MAREEHARSLDPHHIICQMTPDRAAVAELEAKIAKFEAEQKARS